MVKPIKNLCLYRAGPLPACSRRRAPLVAQMPCDVLIAKLIEGVPTSSWYDRVPNFLFGQHSG